MRLINRLAVAAIVLATALPLRAQPSLVILVRHAEKSTEPANDPLLTPAGEARAKALADALQSAQVDAVVTTQLQRTQRTAALVTASRGLTPIIVPVSGSTPTHVQAVADAVRSRKPGEAVLVVGHSNTIPAIIAALGGPTLPDLCDSEYSSLFILSMPPAGSNAAPRLVRGSYGVADGAKAGCPAMK